MKNSKIEFNPKAVLLDLDGTLLDTNDEISQFTVDVIRRLAKTRHVSLNTGRYGPHVLKFARQLQLESPQIGENGASLIDPKIGKIISASYLPEDLVENIIDKLNDSRLDYFISDGMDIIVGMNNEVDRAKITIISVRFPNINIAQIYYERYKTIEQLEVAISIGSDKQSYVMFTKRGVDKAYGVRKLSKLLKIDTADFLAFGDGPNDYTTFKQVGMSIVLPHAPEDVKNIANLIAEPLEQDGVAKAILELGLI